jgi:DNA-directed RNA polymerase specialized sigma24 family protein
MYQPDRGATFMTWATTVIKNFIKTKLRRLGAIHRRNEQYDEIHHSQMLMRTDKTFILTNWRSDSVKRLIAVCPSELAAILQGQLEGYSMVEIASKLGKNYKTLNGNWQRWVTWLRPVLQTIWLGQEKEFEKALEKIRLRYEEKTC